MDYVTMGVKGLAGPSIGIPILNSTVHLPFLVANWDEAIALIPSPFTAALNQKAKDRATFRPLAFPRAFAPTPIANIPSPIPMISRA